MLACSQQACLEQMIGLVRAVVQHKRSAKMPENVALQMWFWEKGSVCLNQEVQCVIDPCLKAHVFIPVLNGHTQRQGKKPAVIAA